MLRIICNKIKCNYCGDVIESKNTHDYKVCKCGKCACYGGLKGLNRDYVYSHEDYIELSITEETEDEVIDDGDYNYESARGYRNKRSKQRKGR